MPDQRLQKCREAYSEQPRYERAVVYDDSFDPRAVFLGEGMLFIANTNPERTYQTEEPNTKLFRDERD